ncbi:U11/U12 small nuclear ribonucleoprotein 48 kDa protein [Orussus abietinus]|uniref:U11/U12 small nuclear ribonucleoprotein 48 kDa protein n=1 Tax=Orussus abietinus TaxID=222816 RepID=UPI0006269CB8|nr:U11/U12 small nuclear ribonucleoprotein 48 kDa protein [Orussus abietinus]
MENTSEARERELQDLDSFVEHSEKDLLEIIHALGWTKESIFNKTSDFINCPFNDSHRMTENSFERHLEACQWKAEGYNEQDIPLSIVNSSSNSSAAIMFDEQLQDDVLAAAKIQNPAMKVGVGDRLIPRTSDRLVADFTSDERKALYDHVIANTVKPDIGDDIADINRLKSDGEPKKMSFLELLAQERNLKRRRAKHRGVHTNKKSHVEILREVIEQQMELYAEYLSDQQGLCSSVKLEVDSASNNNENLGKWSSTKSETQNAENFPLKGGTSWAQERDVSCPREWNGRRPPDFQDGHESHKVRRKRDHDFDRDPWRDYEKSRHGHRERERDHRGEERRSSGKRREESERRHESSHRKSHKKEKHRSGDESTRESSHKSHHERRKRSHHDEERKRKRRPTP